MFPNDFYSNYKSNNFFFKSDLLTRYCLSLYTKPFVILSGISGTGKTKIAQLFTTPDGTKDDKDRIVAIEPKKNSDYFVMNVTEGLFQDGRTNFPYKESVGAIYNEDELKQLGERIDELRMAGKNDNIIDPVRINIRYGEEIIPAEVYPQRASSPLMRVRFKSKRGDDHPFDSRPFFEKNFSKIGTQLRLNKVGEKEFEIVQELSQVDIQENKEQIAEEVSRIGNTCFVSVKSNWTDASEVFGYYNIIEQKYHITPILKFLLTASDYPSVPFFLIMDEMNLSKVEYYFSDFLSCLESRYLKGDTLYQESIQLHTYSELVDSNDILYEQIPNSIKLPENLYVTGTINVDETTYMFSPKVLDRANVLEFNDVYLEKYRNKNDVEEDNIYKLISFPTFGKVILPSQDHFIQLDKTAQDFFIDLNKILTPYNLHFGYRVINEVSLYIINASNYISADPKVLASSIDYQIVQKILPKFNGTLAKLEEPLVKVLQFLTTPVGVVAQDLNYESIEKLEPNEYSYRLSIAKLKTMYLSLYRNGFASFIE